MPSRSARQSGWKSVQSKEKVKEKTKLALYVLGAIIVLLLLSQFFKSIKALNSSWQMDSKKNYVWDGQFNINLIFKSKGTSLISYNPQSQKIIIVDIPDQTLIDGGSFGQWQARALYDLGGDQLVKSSMRDFFGQPIDGFLDFSDQYKQESGQQIVEFIRNNPFGVLNILSHLKTDLTLMELIRLKFGLSSVRFDKVISLDLVNLGVLEKALLLDGTEILTFDPNKLDVALADLADPTIKNEHKSVAIFNATNKSLFAQKWARLVSNIGANIIITTNASQVSDKTQVLGEQSATLKRLTQIFNFHCKGGECDKIQSTDADLSSSRSEINIKLAPDLN